MPEIKNSCAENKGTYKCFLLNVRSHHDYVCLEMDDCPSGLDFQPNDSLSIDSSQVVMPVLDKIRFNIKSTNCLTPLWFENKLEVFAEGRKIFPMKSCCSPECQFWASRNVGDSLKRFGDVKSCTGCTQTDDLIIQQNNGFILDSKEKEVNSNLDKVVAETHSKQRLKNLQDSSIENIIIKNLFSKRSKSEMLTVDEDDSLENLISFSLPSILTPKENFEKCVQTLVSLGNQDFSDEKDINVNKWHDFPRNLNSNLSKRCNLDKDSKLIECTTERFKSFDTNRKIRYWSLIKSARQLMKMNQEVVELNSILKTLALEKCAENKNPLASLSPVNLILKLKKLNRSTSVYNMLSDKPNNRQLYRGRLNDIDLNKIGYFNKLSDTLCHDTLTKKEVQDGINERIKKDYWANKESVVSMDTLLNLQRKMLKMMESFLSKQSSQSSDMISSQQNTQQ